MLGASRRGLSPQHDLGARLDLLTEALNLQTALVKDGYRVRVYVPFGRQWFPYFMRRLGERPANIGFVLRAIARER